MNGGALYFFPTGLDPSHAYVSVNAANELNTLAIVLVRLP